MKLGFSKTWLLGFLGPLVIQLADILQGQTPTIVAYIVALAPVSIHPLVTGIVPIIISWLSAMLLTSTRNDAVKNQTTASVLTGAKEAWK